MVESQKSYSIFKEEISGHDIILYVVQSDSFIHPVVDTPSVVFVKDVNTSKVYYISLCHKDSLVVVDKKTLIADLNQHKGQKWAWDKKSFMQMLPIKNLYDINLLIYLHHAKTLDMIAYETPSHRFIRQSQRECGNLNNVIPILKHKEVFDKMCEEFETLRFECVCDDGYKKENNIIIETLSELELHGIHVNRKLFEQNFENAQVYNKDLVYSQYNLYTPTGRPSNHFDNVNYAALNRSDGTRKCFTSRFNEDGKMILIDYSAFHPRIISHLVNFQIPMEMDIYQYLGELYFRRKNLTEYDIEEAKNLTFRQLYGGVEEKYEGIKYLSNLKSFIFKNWNNFKKYGYVKTPIFKRRISDKHVLDPNPNKLFNYILQATETEIAISILSQINDYLKDKKTKAILYTYDSILFDFHKEDRILINEIIDIMKMDDKFPVKVYAGNSYDEIRQI